MRSSYLPLLVLCVAGCGQSRSSNSSSFDASTPLARPELRNEPNAISVLRAHTVFAQRAGVGGSLVHSASGHKLGNSSGFRTSAIDAVLPAHADQPMHLAVPGRAHAWLDLAAEGARSVEPRIADRAVVHEDAFPATDLVHVLDAGRVEELRVLRTATAKASASWKITRGPDVASLRVNGDRVEALDASKNVIISSEPIFAVDANDVVRTPKVTLDGDRLLVELDTKGLAYPIVLDPSWITTTSNMITGRQSPFMQKLTDGRWLVLGGTSGVAIDLYDPNTDTWATEQAVQHTVSARPWGSSYTVLPSGKILLISSSTAAFAELYDPVLIKSTSTGALVTPRLNHTATLIPSSNKVIVVGGGPSPGSGTLYSTVEVYDIATGAFSSVTPLPTTLGYNVAALLTAGPNAGKILLAGGRGSGYTWLSTAELLDPTTWATTATTNAMSARRSTPTMTLLTKGSRAGQYLIAGGETGAYIGTSTTDFYDPSTNSFSPGPSMAFAHYSHSATTLSDGRVLIAGGNASGGISAVEVYDPTANTWSSLTPPNLGRNYPSLVELSGGRLLLVGDTNKSEVYWPDPVTCTSGTTCPSGNCVDGYCCDTSCTSQCFACDVAGRKGICSPVSGEAPHGSRTACTPYSYCSNGACATTCGSDTVCATGSYCDLSVSKCATKKPTGSGCTAGNECATGYCADGYCCSSSCAGTCSACDVAGSLGTCTAIIGTPHGTRSCPSPYACNAGGSCASGGCTVDTDCATGYFCKAGACAVKLSTGVACGDNGNCSSGNCVDGFCCNTACTGSCQACDVAGKLGTCTNVDGVAPHGTRTCAPYSTCKAGACATSCTAATDCTTGSYCSANKCVGGKALGIACGTGAECTSGFCADGVCCSTACTEDCGTCAAPGTEGTCSPKNSAATCGTAGCSGAKTVALGHCSGTTTACVPGTATPCAGSLICDTTTNACKTSCTADGDCTTGACDTSTGKCTLPDGGVPDTGPADTGMADTGTADTGTEDTGSAPDGTVADTEVPGVDAVAEEPAPHISDHPTVDGFVRCTKGSDCSTGFCVDGVCCDSACTDKCHSCALLSNPGKCSLEPIGVDLRSDCGPANTCLGTCDGKGQCIGAGTGTMCGRNRCTSASTGVGPSYCPAPGAKCPTDDGVVFECSPYLCEPAFGACRTTCAASSDCANGFVCDIDTKTCVAPPPPADSGGGCVFGAPTGGKGLAVFAGLLVAAAFRRRRAL